MRSAVGALHHHSGGTPYTGPLDIVPGAVVAFGPRALSTAKRGTALYTIREDAGDTTQSFNSDATTGDAPVAAITTFLDGANGFVSVWNDQSGNNKNAAQAANANQPGWLASGPNGKPTVTFDGDLSQFLATASITLPNGAYTVFQVVLAPNAVSTGGNPAGINYDQFADAGEVFVGITVNDQGGGIVRVTVDASSDGENTNEVGGRTEDISGFYDSYHVVDSAWTFGSCSIVIDGASKTAVSFDEGAVGSVTGPLAIGAGDANPTRFWFGKIVEWFVYGSILSDADRLAIRQNIASYYGITLS